MVRHFINTQGITVYCAFGKQIETRTKVKYTDILAHAYTLYARSYIYIHIYMYILDSILYFCINF